VARRRKAPPDLIVDTTEDKIPNIPAGEVNKEIAVEPTVGDAPPQPPDDRERVLGEISRLLEKMGLDKARRQRLPVIAEEEEEEQLPIADRTRGRTQLSTEAVAIPDHAEGTGVPKEARKKGYANEVA
jgi:hypothetical protein